jgi:Darcynin, domain of unknown function
LPEATTPTALPLTVFILVKTTPEFLALSAEERFEFVRRDLQPILNELHDKIRLKWFDTEFYNARATDVMMLESKDHRSYQILCEKLRETAFWDRYFRIEEILPGEEHAWAGKYEVDPLRS